jgi:preprotein translocase subunit SecD
MLSMQKRNAPLNKFPAWKYILIIVLVILGIIYSLPNIFSESPALEISMKGGKPIPESAITLIKSSLNAADIKYKTSAQSIYNQQIVFPKGSDYQLKSQSILQEQLGNNYVVALFLAPNTPKWLLALNAFPMKYGLDLQGGIYFLLNVDMQKVLEESLNGYSSQIRPLLIKNRLRYSSIKVNYNNGINMKFRDETTLNKAKDVLSSDKQFQSLIFSIPENKSKNNNNFILNANFTPDYKKQMQTETTQQVVEVMRHRVNELGVGDATVSQQGSQRVQIELPGVQNPAKAKEIIAGTASLSLMLVNEKAQSKLYPGVAPNSLDIPIGSKIYYSDPDNKTGAYILINRPIVTGNAIVGASAGIDQQTNKPIVQVKLSGEQVSHFSHVTANSVGKRLAIVLVQTTFSKQKINGKIKNIPHTKSEVINAATINSALGNSFQITGVGNMNQVKNLALRIRAGALPAPVQIVQDQTIGPSLGAENIQKGTISVIIAMVIIMIFMIFYYGFFGIIANIALILNLIFIVAIMSLIPGATLSLPGIAGIVLNVAMAIDSNVLIFERIREELRNKNTPQNAIREGYDKAFATIVDSNLTTLIVAIILYAMGSGAIKGFAVTLIIGIVSSMFTAITVTRAIVNAWYGSRTVKKISVGI